MHLRSLLTFILTFASIGVRAGVWDADSIRGMFDGRPLSPIEGVWQFPGDGAVIAVTPSTATTYNIYMLDSPKLDMPPGALIGEAVITSRTGYYDGHLGNKGLTKKKKLKSENVTFTVTDEGSLMIKPYKTGKKISFRRWISYFLKVTIIDNDRRPTDLDGAIRVYPPSLKYPVHL